MQAAILRARLTRLYIGPLAGNPFPDATPEFFATMARALSLGLDRTSAPMAEPREKGARKNPRRARKKPRVRAIPPPIDVNYRMAYVGTVTYLDEYGESSGNSQSALEDELTYLNNNKDRMRYAGLARRGLPIGSGVTESAAKTVINQRAKGAGQRWKEPGLRAVLGVRGIVQSARLKAFWLHF